MKRATGIQVSLMIDQCTDFALFVVIHLLSHVQLFMTPWTAAHQVSLSFTISRSLLKLMSIELLMTLGIKRPKMFMPFNLVISLLEINPKKAI